MRHTPDMYNNAVQAMERMSQERKLALRQNQELQQAKEWNEERNRQIEEQERNLKNHRLMQKIMRYG